MDFLINMGAKLSGLAAVFVDLLPMVGGMGSLLVIGGSILVRASSAPDIASAIHALQPTVAELAAAGMAAGLIKAHFNHLANRDKLDEHAEQLSVKP